MTVNNLFSAEYARGKERYPDSLWSTLTYPRMMFALIAEVWELCKALWRGRIYGEHGAIREAVHCQVVLERIIEELSKRNSHTKEKSR